MRSNGLNELSWPEVEEYLKTDDVAIIPIGSTEQHGPGGMLGLDTYVAVALAEDAAKRTNVITTPPVWFGDSSTHLGFPGTISLKPETVVAIIKDIIHSLAKHGFKKFVVVNGHKGANNASITLACRALQEYELPHVRTALADPLFLATDASKIKGDLQEHHAGTLEISHVLYKFPEISLAEHFPSENAKLDEEFGEKGYMRKDLFSDPHPPVELFWNSEQQKRFAPEGHLAPSDKASKEIGEKYHNNMVNNLVSFIEWFKTFEG